ncbi:MAG: N-6 DNA methylase [Anaerolineales bacterium]|nr:N-6 DNA methylase [Anaerolineales bacterium]
MLTILALMKRKGVTLPERRVQLCDQYVKTLLSTWNRARSMSGRATGRDLEEVQTTRVLALLALWMHEVNPGVGLVKRPDLHRKLEEIFSARNAPDPESASAQFLLDVREHAALLLEPQPGERIYDPTCGTGGMLISALDEVKRKGGEYRTLKLYGQERNHMTASIARMNLALHGVDDFAIARGDTLENPVFTEHDRLATFDVVLANPPSSIKQWNREAWQSDVWGRNFLGTPPQGRADYAFFQHILKSLSRAERTLSDSEVAVEAGGRCAILFPHGVLFRKEEADMRQKLVDADLVDCVLGLGPNLFYNSPMEACIVICRMDKPAARRGKVLFINAVDELTRERSMSYLKPEHQERIADAYHAFADVDGFAKVATQDEIRANDGNLSIPLYVRGKSISEEKGEYAADGLREAVRAWDESSEGLAESVERLLKTIT